MKKEMRADGILYPGDVILSINDVVVEDQVQFYDVSEATMLIINVYLFICLFVCLFTCWVIYDRKKKR